MPGDLVRDLVSAAAWKLLPWTLRLLKPPGRGCGRLWLLSHEPPSCLVSCGGSTGGGGVGAQVPGCRRSCRDHPLQLGRLPDGDEEEQRTSALERGLERWSVGGEVWGSLNPFIQGREIELGRSGGVLTYRYVRPCQKAGPRPDRRLLRPLLMPLHYSLSGQCCPCSRAQHDTHVYPGPHAICLPAWGLRKEVGSWLTSKKKFPPFSWILTPVGKLNI